MPNVICAKLAFNPIHCFSKRTCHDCCIVDQDINLLDASVDVCGSLSYGRLAAEIDADELRLDLWVDGVNAINDWLDLGQGTTSKDDQGRRTSGETCCGLCTYTSVAGAGDEDWYRVSLCCLLRKIWLTGLANHHVFESLHNL